MKTYVCFFKFLLIFFFFSADLMAQYGETIRTGRPGKSIGTFSVGERVLQVQGGLEYFQSELTNAPSSRDLFQSVLVVRYGVSERIELSTAWIFNSEKNIAINSEQSISGISGSQIGFRVNLSDGKKAPPMCFQYRLKLKAVSWEYKTEFIGSRALFAIAQPIKKTRVFVNLGFDWNGNTAAPKGIYVLSYFVPVVPKLSAMIEYYGNVPLVNNLFDQDWTSNVDLGLSYVVNKDLKLDLSMGTNITKVSDAVFVNLGFSWRTRFAQRTKAVSPTN